jgi:hypothetical protein
MALIRTCFFTIQKLGWRQSPEVPDFAGKNAGKGHIGGIILKRYHNAE